MQLALRNDFNDFCEVQAFIFIEFFVIPVRLCLPTGQANLAKGFMFQFV